MINCEDELTQRWLYLRRLLGGYKSGNSKEDDEWWQNLYMELQQSFNEQKHRFGKGSSKQLNSPREHDDDDDDDDDDTPGSTAMIRQQLYGPDGPNGSKSEDSQCTSKWCRDDEREHAGEPSISQQPVKRLQLHSPDSEHPEISSYRADGANRKPANTQQKSSFRKGSLKRLYKSPREHDNDDDNHETLAMIRQQLYGPNGPYGNRTNSQSSECLVTGCKRRRDEDEDEDDVVECEEDLISQQPRKKIKYTYSDYIPLENSWCGGDMANLMPVNNRQKSSFRKGSRKRLYKSPRIWDNDDNNYETIAMIRQQMYGPGGPYENKSQTENEPKCSKDL